MTKHPLAVIHVITWITTITDHEKMEG